MSNKKKMSRKEFLRTAGAFGVSAAAAGMLSGCKSGGGDVSWDREVDVVVLGSGTGMMAAIRAAEQGLDTLVLEKAAVAGGTTGISGGGIYIPNNYVMEEMGIDDSREEALTYLEHATFGQGDMDLLETYVDTCNEVVQYMRDNGVEEWSVSGMFQDYYPNFPGGKANGRNIGPVSDIEGVSGGGYLIQKLQAAAEDHGAEFLFNTAGQHLIVEDGRIVGVQAESDGEELFVKANVGVVLATGGYDHDKEMTNHFHRGPLHFSTAVQGNTGDGQKMAMEVGASLRNMNECWGAPGYFHEGNQSYIVDWAMERGKPGAIIVNKHGERFLNESASYDAVGRSFYHYDSGANEYRNIPGYTIIDSAFRERYTLLYTPPGQDLPDFVARGDSVRELAENLGIDPDGLEATVEQFNENAKEGVDPEYLRGESAFDTSTGGDPSRDDLENVCLAPLETPPYYGLAIWPGTIGTNGGAQINSDAQVVTPFGETIPGLYAVGNACGSPFGAGYAGGGCTVGSGLVFSYLAANHMADQQES
jgi:succinate dehydrogenase/fumarate reductase flavoprotein subunit